MDAYFDDTVLSPTDERQMLVDFPNSPRHKSDLYARYAPPDTNSNLSLADLNNSFLQCDPNTLAHRRLPAPHSPTASLALNDIFGPPSCEEPGEPSAASWESVHRLFNDKRVNTTGSALTDQTEPLLDLTSPLQSRTATAINTPNTGTDAPTRPGSSCSSSGWMNTLHMAAQRGHTGIVRVRKRHPNRKLALAVSFLSSPLLFHVQHFLYLKLAYQCPESTSLTLNIVVLKQNMDPNEHDSDGLTSIMHTAAAGHDDVASLLLAHGARLSEVDSRRRSALHWAVLKNRETVLRLLLKQAANDHSLIDGYDDGGRTPLHTAIDLGFESCVAALLESGANMHSRARKP